MGGNVLVPIVEESAGKALAEWTKGWFTHSGEAQLKSLGPQGEFTANLLKKYEQFAASNKSFARESIKKIFDEVPSQYHPELEKQALGNPHNLPQQYAQQGQRLTTLKNTIESKAQQSGQVVIINGRRVPLVVHPDGPYAHHPDILRPNSDIRKQAIQEVGSKLGVTRERASTIIDATIRPQYGRNGVSHISFPQTRINAGRLPVDQRWSQWGEKAAEKISQNVFFGPSDQNLQAVVESVRHGQGQVSAETLADFLDVYFKETQSAAWRRGTGVPTTSSYEATQQAEKVLHKVTGYVMTSRIALPHSTQLINTVLNDGLRNTLAGIHERLTNWDQVRDFVVNSGVLEEELSRVNRVAIEGKPTLFEKLFHQPGFNWIRARQVEITALAGKHEAIEASDRFLKGDTRAELTLKRLGIDTQELKRTNVLSDTMKQQAMYNAGNNAIFFRTPLNTPFKREAGPLGRVTFTYAHYHFNMFRTIKNSLKNVRAEQGLPGIAKWMAKIGILFPVAGQFVQYAENGLYRKDLSQSDLGSVTGDEVVDRYLNAIAHASAFGMIYSINRVNKKTIVSNMVQGPVASTGVNVVGDVWTSVAGQFTRSGSTKHDWRPVERDVLRHIPVVGPTVSGTIVPYEEKPIHVSKRPSRHKTYEQEGNIF